MYLDQNNMMIYFKLKFSLMVAKNNPMTNRFSTINKF